MLAQIYDIVWRYQSPLSEALFLSVVPLGVYVFNFTVIRI